MDLDFYKTKQGQIFFNSQLSKLISAIERLADALEKNNKLENKKAVIEKKNLKAKDND